MTEFDPNENKESEFTGEYEIDEETGDTLKISRRHYIMDGAFKCKYQVVRKMFNYLESDTVEFIAYDHYGTPGFAESDTVILYLSKSEDGSHYFHQKYQYDNIFKDKKGNYFSYPKFPGTKYTTYKDSLKGFKAILKNEKFNIKDLSKETVESYYPKEFNKMPDKEEKARRKQIQKVLQEKAQIEFEKSLPISRENFQNLFDFLDEELEKNGCNDRLTYTKQFLATNKIQNGEEVENWLKENGGYCDCEVLHNVEELFED